MKGRAMTAKSEQFETTRPRQANPRARLFASHRGVFRGANDPSAGRFAQWAEFRFNARFLGAHVGREPSANFRRPEIGVGQVRSRRHLERIDVPPSCARRCEVRTTVANLWSHGDWHMQCSYRAGGFISPGQWVPPARGRRPGNKLLTRRSEMHNQITRKGRHLRRGPRPNISRARYIGAMLDESVEVNDGYGLTLQRGGVLDER